MIPGKFIAIFSFMGTIVHEWAHALACKIFGVKVLEIKYWSSDGGYVKHEQTDNIKANFFISFAPLFVNSFITIIFGFIIALLMYFDVDNTFIYVILIYFAITIGMHAFPSKADTENLMNICHKLKKKKMKFISNVLDSVFSVIRILKFFWLDVLYAALLIMIPIFILKSISPDFKEKTRMENNSKKTINALSDSIKIIKTADLAGTDFPVSVYTEDRKTGASVLKKSPYGADYSLDYDRDTNQMYAYTNNIPKKDCNYIISKNWNIKATVISPGSCNNDTDNVLLIIKKL